MNTLRTVSVGSGRPELWLVAGVHGDEVEGMVVVEEALRANRPDRGTIVGLPVAHPAALARGTREGPEGADLNRTYPGRAEGTPTERTAFELWQLLESARPDAIVTFHSWSRSGSATPYVEHALGDETGRDLALALGLPFVEAWDWPAGLLGREVRALGIPSAELELFGLGRHTDEGLAFGLGAATGAAAWLKMSDPVPMRTSTEVDRFVVSAPEPGRVVQCAALGGEVAQGDRVAELRDAGGQTTAVLSAPASGWVGIHVTYGQVSAGDPVTVIFVPRRASGSEET
jgi:predicted deacylase